MKRWSIALCALLLGVALGYLAVGTFTHGQPANPGAAPVPKEFTSYRDVVKKVLPAVVSIETKMKTLRTKGKVNPAPSDDPSIPEEFRKFFKEFGRMPDMSEAPRLGFGSGFIVDPAGVILTNYHVVDGADQVVVQLHDGRKFTSRNIKGDRRTDLAVVILDAKGPFPTLDIGDSDAMEIGDRVLAVGAPFGLVGSVTHGIISAKGRNGLNMNMYEDFLQTDAAINPGNSGGPLVNLEGKVVGINSAIKSRSGGFQGVGLAVSSNLAQKVVKSLRTDGVVRRGYLGVQIRDLQPEVADRLNLPKDAGVVVAEVFDNTPAAKAGIQPGDVVTAIAGRPVRDGKVLQSIVADLPLGKASAIEIYRDGKKLSLQVTIEEQPGDFGSASAPAPRAPQPAPDSIGIAKIGVDLADLNDDMADDLGYKKGTRGAVITRVEPGSLAADAGLKKGMLISRVDNQKVAGAANARQALEAASLQKGVLLQVQSPQGGTNFVLLRGEGASE